MFTPASIRGAGTAKSTAKQVKALAGRFCVLTTALFLVSGCATDSRHHALAPPPPAFNPADAALAMTRPAQMNDMTPASMEGLAAAPFADSTTLSDAEISAALGARRKAFVSDCSIGDRFDRDTTLAYNFKDGQSRLGLDIDGLSYDSLEIEAVKLEFRYRFSSGKTKKEKCRYESGFQGLVGSSYNEFVRREHNTIWNDIEDRGLNFWGR